MLVYNSLRSIQKDSHNGWSKPAASPATSHTATVSAHLQHGCSRHQHAPTGTIDTALCWSRATSHSPPSGKTKTQDLSQFKSGVTSGFWYCTSCLVPPMLNLQARLGQWCIGPMSSITPSSRVHPAEAQVCLLQAEAASTQTQWLSLIPLPHSQRTVAIFCNSSLNGRERFLCNKPHR